mgnify:CR=1 FL=1
MLTARMNLLENTTFNTVNQPGLDDLNTEQVTVVCTSNNKYLKPLKSFLHSIKLNSPDTQVVIRLVNVDSHDVDVILDIGISKYIIWEDRELSTQRRLQPNGLGDRDWKQLLNNVTTAGGFRGAHQFQSDEACYCSNIKFNTMNLALQHDFDCVLYLDVDTIVRDDLSTIKLETDGHDMGMFICSDEIGKFHTYYDQAYSGWHAGLMVARNTKNTVKFYQELEQRVSSKMFDIEADEDEFEYLYNIYKDDLSIKLMDEKYKDTGPVFNDMSVMWSGQAEIKVSSEQYIKEYNKYQ